ncbi:prepilin peptidase [Conexibacter sp. CPCC 206217]|uniref:prepilin peptidase n=1 Tax=Conexibacter sp. CPCC 206217 TaxID=3064574 RepID=UPI002721F598|nr:prepilin peptidase [Conexibacter sp. CPCC 206217]MDO8210826.1 prepilin peptidase [Conexibacter sp. CPCC 206217]
MAHRHSLRLQIALACAGATLLALVVLVADGTRERLIGATLVALLVPVTWIDLDRRLIPNRLTAAGALAALAIGLVADPARLPAQLLWGTAAGGFLLAAALIRPDGMGMGDVKLAAVLGLLLESTVVVALLVALVTAALAGAALAIRRGIRSAREATLPLGPFLALGACVAFAAGAELSEWWLG